MYNRNEIKKVMPILPAGKIQGIFKLNKRIGRSLEFLLRKNRDDRSFLTPAASSLQRHSEPQAKNPKKIILNNWILRFAPAQLRMTVSVLALLLSLNLSTAWADYVWDTDCGEGCSWEIIPGPNGNTLKITGNGGAMKNFGSDPADIYTVHLAPWNKEENNITSVIVDGFSSVGNYAFSDMSAITTASISNTASIGNSAFINATSLTSVDMPNVETIGSDAFANATSLTSVEMPNVEIIGNYAFMYASSLTDVEMPNVEKIGHWAFYNATSLTSVDMPNIESIRENAFENATNLSYVGLNNNFDEEGFFLDANNNRVVLDANVNNVNECNEIYGKWVGEWGNGICYAGLASGFSKPFSNTGVDSTCGQGGSCGTCTGYLVSGRGCVTADTCEDLAHYKWDSSTNSCNRIQTAQNNQSSGTGTGTTTAASCTNGASIGGECFPKRYTPAEIAELVGESNTILLYYK